MPALRAFFNLNLISEHSVEGFIIGNPFIRYPDNAVIFRIIADYNRFYAGIDDKAFAHTAWVRL